MEDIRLVSGVDCGVVKHDLLPRKHRTRLKQDSISLVS